MTKVEALCVSACVWVVLCFAGPAMGSLGGYPSSPRHPLEQAARDGDLERVRSLLAEEENEYVRDYALRFAIQGRHREVADLLISRGARNALMVAAAEGDASFVKDLLAQGTTANAKDSALHAAARGGHKEAAELLLSAGANVNATRFGDYTPLFVAAAAGCDLDTVQRFTNFPLSPWSANMTERKRSPVNPETFREVVELLIRHGADVNAREKQHGFTPLHYAVFGGSREVVAALLDHGAPADPAIPAGATAGRYLSPLHLAAHYGDLAICELLVARGTGVNSKLPTESKLWIEPTQRTSLHHAAESGNGELVRFLVEHGAEVNAADSRGQTALLVASECADANAVETLLSHGADANATDKEGRTALHHAAERRDAVMVKTLLSRGADADRKSRDGRTPTSIATGNGGEEIVKLLTNRNGRVTIHAAAGMGDLAALERLVKEGIDVNRLDVQGQTALHAAANAGQLEAVRWLVEHGAKMDFPDEEGATALSIATRQAYSAHDNLDRAPNAAAIEIKYKAVMSMLIGRGAMLDFSYGIPQAVVQSHCDEVADLIIAAGPDFEPGCDTKATLLHRAAWWGRKKTAEDLIRLGADLEAVDSAGGTPLHAAMQSGSTRYWDVIHGPHVDVAELLLKHGAKINAKNNGNLTALHGAASYGDIAAMDLLLAHGADPNMVSGGGSTVLMILLGSLWFDAEKTDAEMKDFIFSLIRRGVRVDAQNSEGVTVLQQAAALEFPDLLQELLSRGAPVNARSKTGWTALHSAVAAGHERCVEMLLEHGADPNSLGCSPTWVPGIPWHRFEKTAVSPLQIALSQEDDRIVQMLIAAGADVNLAGSDGKTPLVPAFEKKDTVTLKLLLDNGIDANVRTSEEIPLVYLAASKGRRDVVELLLSHGARGDAAIIKALLETGTTPLHEAAGRGDVEEARTLLDAGAKADVPNREGLLPIHRANAGNHAEAVRLLIPKTPASVLTDLLFGEAADGSGELISLLIAHGADIDSHKSFRQLTPLHRAVEKGNTRAIRLLIAQGADIDAQDESGETPLGAAVFRKQKESVALFLSHGAQTNTLYKSNDLKGCTPLHIALRYGASDIAEMLVSAGSDVNVKGGYGRMAPLHMALGNKALFELMLQHGGEIDNPSGNGMTCLHMAAASGQEDWVRYLIERGARVNVQDRNGDTPLHWAAKGAHGKVCRVLLDHKADIRIKNNKGLLALQYAQASGLDDIVVDLTPKTR